MLDARARTVRARAIIADPDRPQRIPPLPRERGAPTAGSPTGTGAGARPSQRARRALRSGQPALCRTLRTWNLTVFRLMQSSAAMSAAAAPARGRVGGASAPRPAGTGPGAAPGRTGPPRRSPRPREGWAGAPLPSPARCPRPQARSRRAPRRHGRPSRPPRTRGTGAARTPPPSRAKPTPRQASVQGTIRVSIPGRGRQAGRGDGGQVAEPARGGEGSGGRRAVHDAPGHEGRPANRDRRAGGRGRSPSGPVRLWHHPRAPCAQPRSTSPGKRTAEASVGTLNAQPTTWATPPAPASTSLGGARRRRPAHPRQDGPGRGQAEQRGDRLQPHVPRGQERGARPQEQHGVHGYGDVARRPAAAPGHEAKHVAEGEEAGEGGTEAGEAEKPRPQADASQ
jgi:hypothetical protein